MAQYGYQQSRPPPGLGVPYGVPAAPFPAATAVRATATPFVSPYAMPSAPAPFPGAVPPPAPFPGALPPQSNPQPVRATYAQGPAATAAPPVTRQMPANPAFRATAEPPPPAAQPRPFVAARPRYPIDERQLRNYSNLYSIIATIEVLQQAYSEGAIDEVKRDSFLKGLLQQFDTVIKGLRISLPDVERFCDATDLAHGFAWSVITSPPDFNQPSAVAEAPQPAARASMAGQGRSRVAFDVSQNLVELLDMCHLKITDPNGFRQKITEIRSLFQSAGAIPGDAQITAFTEKWYQFFRTLRAEEVPLSKIEELKIEASDCNIWARDWFTRLTSIL